MQMRRFCRNVAPAAARPYAGEVKTPTYYDFAVPDEGPSGWIKVSGTAVPHPLSVRVEMAKDGPRVVGMQIDDVEALTGADLRLIRLGELVEHLVEHLREQYREDLYDLREADRELDFLRVDRSRLRDQGFDAQTPEGFAMMQFDDAGASMDRLSGWYGRSVPPGAGELARGRGASAPTVADLEAFAMVLGDERVRKPHGAVTRTARRIGVDRSTAHRWITRCRDAGLITAGADR